MQREIRLTRLAVGLRVIWTLLAIGMMLYIFAHAEEKDADIVFIIGMTALTFPVGIFVALLITGVLAIALTLFGVQFENSIPFYFLVWAIYASAGYAQWFYILPRVRRRLKTSSATARSK